MKAKKGSKVKIHYTGTLDDGTVFDSSEGKDPISFEIGAKQVIPGFEDSVIGMDVNEEKDVVLEIKDAYGEYKKELVQVVPKDKLPPNIDPKKGMVLQLQNVDGKMVFAKIKDVSEKDVTFDFNHPLAGKKLHFKLKVVEVA